jgi:hypothetical protein
MTDSCYSLPAQPSHWEIWHLLKQLQEDHPDSFKQAIQDLFIRELQEIRMEAAELSQELARTEADLDLAERKLLLIRQVLDQA